MPHQRWCAEVVAPYEVNDERFAKPPCGVKPALLVAFWQMGGGNLALRTLRAQRALICGSKCRKSFFFPVGGLLRAKKEMG